jgi:ubiquinone/menaquinone biosynthesis C-methylase UbiE
MTFKDHFSGHADAYSRARPTYPASLFAWLSRQTSQHDLAWDCGTGNGQAALGLAPHYRQVIGTDASAAQIAQAPPHPQTTWRVARENESGLADQTADLATVAQSLHWFDAAAYFGEVARVLKPGGVVAAWTYGLLQIQGEIDAAINDFYWNEVWSFWPPERRMVENGYRDLVFPFERIEAPPFEMRSRLNLDGVLDYIGTWSAVQRYRKELSTDPIPGLRERLRSWWGDPASVREVAWPVAMRAGRK